MRRLQALAARFCHASQRFHSAIVGPARPLASPPAALPWARSTSYVGPSTGTSALSSGCSGSLATWGAAWRWALGLEGGVGGNIPARQQLSAVRGLEGNGSSGLQPTTNPSASTGAASLGSCNAFSGPSAATLSSRGALGSRTAGCVPQVAGGVTGSVRSMASGAARGGPMGTAAAAGQLARGMSHSSSGAGGSWKTAMDRAIAIFTQTVVRFCALYVGVCAYVWYENLEQVPYSGRWRAVRPTLAESAEEQGRRQHEAAIAVYRSKGALLPDDHPDVLLVRRLGGAVVEAAVKGLGDSVAAERLRGLQWEFEVVDDGQGPNASVWPGGKVVMHKSMLDEVYRDEDLLACVLAHEVAHEVAQHTAEDCSNAANAMAANAMVYVALRRIVWVHALSAMISSVHLLFASQGVWSFLRPLLWYKEFEADAIAMQLMARAGFNPGAAVSYHWLMDNSFISKICREVVGNRDLLSRLLLELTSTHPSRENRMQRAWQQLPAACRTYTEAGFGTCDPEESFRQVQERMELHRMERPI